MIALAIATGACSLWVVFEQDIYWQIRAGDELWTTHRLPDVDTWSYSARGAPWLNIQWLSTLILRGIFALGGEAALVWGRAALVTALLSLVGVIVLRAARQRSVAAQCLMVATLLPLAYTALWPRLQLRSDTFVLLTFFLLMRVWQSEHAWPRRAMLTCLCVLIAANLHAGTAPFVVIAAVAWILSTAPLPQSIPWAVACVGLFFVTPYSYRVLPILWNHVFYYEHNILRNSDQLPLDWVYLSPRGNAYAGLAWLLYLFSAAAALGMALWGRVTRALIIQYTPIILCALLFSAMCINRVRAIPYQMAFLLPFLAMSLARLPAWSSAIVTAPAWGMAAACVMSLHILWGFGVHEHLFPAGSTHFVARQRPAPNILHTFAFGAYMVWYLREYPLYVDTRETMYWPLQPEVLGAYHSPEITQALITKYGINTMLMPIPKTRYIANVGFEDVLARYLPRDHWATVYFDNISFVDVRRVPENAIIIAAHEYKVLQPNLPANAYPLSKDRSKERDELFVAEINRCLQEEPTNVYCQIAQATWWRVTEPERRDDAITLLEQADDYIRRWTSPHQITLMVELAALYKAADRQDDAARLEAQLGEGVVLRNPTLPMALP